MAGDYVRRTAITRLSVTEEQRGLLEKTITEWKRGCQLAVEMAWSECHTKRDVQSLAYDTIRDETELGSQHAVLATHQAAEAIRSCLDQQANGAVVSKPTFTSPTISYDARTMTLFNDDTVSLATTESRLRCRLVLSDTDEGYQQQYLTNDDWSVTQSTLTIQDGECLLHIGFRRPKTDTERNTAEDGTVLGVDLGIENLAVTSTAQFYSGRELRHRLQQFERVRAGLQKTGTRSAHRTLAQASGRVDRYTHDLLHHVSSGIITEALRYDCDVIAFENLSRIRDQTDASWGHRWAFRTLFEYVEYKAESVGILVRQVESAYTSKRCAECGAIADENRTNRSGFQCQSCGSEANADYNAAKNIGFRYVRRGQQSSRRTGDSRLALKSGTVRPNGGFTAYPDGFEAEFMDNHHRSGAKPSG